MTTNSVSSLQAETTPIPVAPSASTSAIGDIFRSWRSNYALILTVITLLALGIGWAGEALGVLPQWAIMLTAIVAYGAGGYTGFTGAMAEARQGKLDIDFLMIAAAVGAALIGAWHEGALLLFLFTLSGALETFALERTREAIKALADLRPDAAEVRRNGQSMVVPVEELVIGDIVLVRPGERIAVDGTVISGLSSVDQSPITGESVPVHKAQGDSTFAGSINGSGALEVEVTKLATESTLSKIINLVEEAREDAAPTQHLIDRLSQPYTYIVIAATIVAILIPTLFANEPFANTFYRAMTLLVVASPCALIISTPASILSAIAAAARQGVLFKGGAYLESMAQIDTVAFDKTGTLTHGKPMVTALQTFNDFSETELLHIAASAEQFSEHHIAAAIVDKAQELNVPLETPDEFEAIAGHGIRASYIRTDAEGEPYEETTYLGNAKLFESLNIELPAETHTVGRQLQAAGQTAILVMRQYNAETPEAIGFVAVADALRDSAIDIIAQLRAAGVKTIAMLTGDNADVAQKVAKEVGIDEVYADLLPEQKVEIIKQLSERGKTVMIGDGVNDAPALATATVGVAMGAGGTDVALETADLVLMSSDLSKLPFTLRLSKQAGRIVRQNLIFAVSVILVLVTATILVPLLYPGFVLPLPLGVVGHEGSTLLVVANGLRMLAMRE
ncbi:MAG: cadmium-translocating P-type ATPase [Caldilineaceae bacterium]|nr:cadmium-translocating P-type ATPase [Caldilineaceae bacterium]